MTTTVNTPLEIAQALVRIPSVNPDFDPQSRAERDAAAWIEQWARANDFEVWTQEVLPGRPNVTLRLRNGADHPHVLFNGHTDTVAVTGMTIAPFGGEVSNERLWGRGACDMKGPLACMLAAAIRLREQKDSWRGMLSVGCVIDEEFKYRGILALMDKIEPLDFAIVGEPTSMQVVRGCKGALRFQLEARGLACHSSEPHKGRSAIVAIADAVLQLEDFFRERLSEITLPEFGTSTGSVGVIEGGTGVNIVPDRSAIRVDIRLLPGQDWRTTYGEIQTWIRSHATRVPGIEWTFSDPLLLDIPFETPIDHTLVTRACATVQCARPQIVKYGCDASKIAVRGVPSIVLGPGDIAHAHTKDESIAISELESAANAYVRLAQTLMPPIA